MLVTEPKRLSFITSFFKQDLELDFLSDGTAVSAAAVIVPIYNGPKRTLVYASVVVGAHKHTDSQTYSHTLEHRRQLIMGK